MSTVTEIVLEPFPDEGGALVLVSTSLAGMFNVSTRAFAIEVRRCAEKMLASAALMLRLDETMRAIRFRTGNVELMLLTALVPFDGRPYGVLCAVLPSEQLAGQKAIAQLVAKVRKQLEGRS